MGLARGSFRSMRELFAGGLDRTCVPRLHSISDAVPSRKERGHRGVRPRHPSRKAFAGRPGRVPQAARLPRRFGWVHRPPAPGPSCGQRALTWRASRARTCAVLRLLRTVSACLRAVPYPRTWVVGGCPAAKPLPASRRAYVRALHWPLSKHSRGRQASTRSVRGGGREPRFRGGLVKHPGKP